MSLFNKYNKEIELFVKVCHRLANNMFVTGFGGNMAWKLDDDVILITPTQMNKGDITKKDLVFLNMAGDTLGGTKRPTGEKPMYLEFFNKRSDITSVVHCHPPCVCATAILEDESILMRPYYPETVTEVGPVPTVPYGEPLTLQLAENFAPFLQKYNSFIMKNHGLVTMTTGDIYWTLLTVELLESSVNSILKAMSVGSLKELSKEALTNLGNVMKTRDLPLFGAPGINKTLEGMYF
ncbi:MAG: class II aldolase/adducin family protein [Victivallales bacterium]|nr:class II aldolase/adducin family protein [Victivallales bacterium]